MSFDAVDALRQAGNPVDVLTDQQREVISNLTPAEVQVLNSVKSRIDAVGDADVEGHAAVVGVGIF